ncbi:unnamed protein product [Peniophora sp. CBMAI 1063]|nr:unnamed protein product [Peniophora sp. CBMAI 1063]
MFHFALLFLLSSIVQFASAELYVASPDSSTTCSAGKACTVTWLDNGVAPTLETIGVCTVGLYHGTQQLVQMIDAVNVATSHSLSFTPQANAGPNSDSYYIALKSKTQTGNSTSDYVGFSANFRLTGMTGSFDSPVPSLTSSIAVPSSLTDSNAISTSTLPGTVTISVSSATTTPTQTSPSSRMTTSSARSSSAASSASAAGASSSASASAAGAASSALVSRPTLGLVSAFFLSTLAFVAYV